MPPRYITKKGLGKVDGCDTYEDLQRYLMSDPHPDYRLVSAIFANNWILIFELKD